MKRFLFLLIACCLFGEFALAALNQATLIQAKHQTHQRHEKHHAHRATKHHTQHGRHGSV
jgi:Ni/Co efflux regulator RcnB